MRAEKTIYREHTRLTKTQWSLYDKVFNAYRFKTKFSWFFNRKNRKDYLTAWEMGPSTSFWLRLPFFIMAWLNRLSCRHSYKHIYWIVSTDLGPGLWSGGVIRYYRFCECCGKKDYLDHFCHPDRETRETQLAWIKFLN